MSFYSIDDLATRIADMDLKIKILEQNEVLNKEEIEELKLAVSLLKSDKLNKSEFEIEIRKFNLELENINKFLERNEERENKVDDKLEKISVGQEKLFRYGFAGLGSIAVVFTIVGNITGTKIDIVSIFVSLLGLGG